MTRRSSSAIIRDVARHTGVPVTTVSRHFDQKVQGKRWILFLRGLINQEDSKRREVDVKPKKRNNVKGGENLRRICTLLP